MKSLFWSARSAAVAVALVVAVPAAQAQQPYFVGQTIELLSAYSEGSEGNVFLQEFAHAVERLWPGTRMVFRPGSSTALTAEILFNAAPDGLTIGSTDTDSLVARATGEDIHDVSDFDVIGALTQRRTLLWGSTAAGITTLEQLHDPIIIAVRSVTSGTRFTSLLLNAYLGTRLTPVTGYSSSEGQLAFFNGETGAAVEDTVSGLEFIANGVGTPLLLLVARDDNPVVAPYDTVPRLVDQRGAEEFAWVPEFLKGIAYGRAIGVPKGLDPQKLEDLRDLFMQVMVEPGFVAAMSGISDIVPTRGDVLQAGLESMLSTFGEIGPLVERALACGEQIAATGEACAP